MNLHEQLDKLIATQEKTNELLAQLTGGSAPAATKTAATKTAAGSKTAASKKAEEKKPEITVEQAHDAAMELKDKHGVAVVKAILASNKVAKLAEMTEAQAPGVYKGCIDKMAELDAGADEAEEDDGI